MSLPLNIELDLSNVKTAMPLIADGTTTLIRLMKIDGKSADQDKEGIPKAVWIFQTVNPCPTSEGDTLAPNHTIPVTIPLAPNSKTAEEYRDWYLKRTSEYMDALLGTGDRGNKKGKPERPKFNDETISKMIGATALAKFSIATSRQTGELMQNMKLTFPGDVAP